MKLNSRKLELLMARKNINVTQLVEKSGVSRATISTVRLRGTCHILTAAKLAAALGVDVEEIIAKED